MLPSLWDTSFYFFSMWNLDQIWHPMAVSKSAHHDDSKTLSTCLIWWSFGWEIWGWRQLIFFMNQFCLHLFLCQLYQSIHQHSQRSIWNLLVMRIPKLIVEIDEELTEIFEVRGKAQFPKSQWKDFSILTSSVSK